MISPSLTRAPGQLELATLPRHVPLAVQTRDGVTESVHYGSAVATAADGTTLLAAGDPSAPFYPRSALKPLQAVAMIRAGLDLPVELLALAAASHSGAAAHRDGARRILELHGLTPAALANSTDLPYGARERQEWLAEGGKATQLVQNCSGKHAAMAATCVINGWPVGGYLDPAHPLQQLVTRTVVELAGEEPQRTSTDGCGTPLFALTLGGMARAFGKLAAGDGHAEATVADAMRHHPEMVAGEGRDVTALMRLVPGLVAKDGFEGVQLVGLPDGRAVAVKISDGGDRARLPVTVRLLAALDVDPSPLAGLAAAQVLGGGRPVGLLQATDFLRSPDATSTPDAR
jgi:L-asparaginase II